MDLERTGGGPAWGDYVIRVRTPLLLRPRHPFVSRTEAAGIADGDGWWVLGRRLLPGFIPKIVVLTAPFLHIAVPRELAILQACLPRSRTPAIPNPVIALITAPHCTALSSER
ncbi:hypothetical protein [Comamonas odontotermitis]|uniref:hypothetical protein n=1 Tax=Comamonas odontotermitis TaxID=379895 RepID=UPI0037518F92